MQLPQKLPFVARAGAIAMLLAALPMSGHARSDDLAQRCWSESVVWRTRPDLREPTAVSFGNLRNGDVVRAPFWIDFGIRGMGVIPAGNPNTKAGHHHLLIDTPLPVQYQAKIPSSNAYRHFGKGQTGTLLDLPPGRHTLRLLFADHDHRPYFVYSPEIAITVEGRRTDPPIGIDPSNFEGSCRQWLADQMTAPQSDKPHVYLRNIRAHEALPGAAIVGMGVVGPGVAPEGSNIATTGHFVLTAFRDGALVERKDLRDGRTETLLDLPRGSYQLQVQLVSEGGNSMLTGEPVPITVTGTTR